MVSNTMVRTMVVRHRVVGIKDSSKTVVRNSDLSQHNVRNSIINDAGVKLSYAFSYRQYCLSILQHLAIFH